ncbi:MAG: putative glutamine amidotransferase [Subtercola sp.]|nr:putative glutamine amidotransferase [Subtercola sp.]
MTGRGQHAEQRPHLAVVEVTRFRPRDAAYHAYVDMLNSRVVAEAEAQGFRVTRTGAADVGTAQLLAITDSAEAIVIMGGEDIAPRFYSGAPTYPAQGQHFETADEGQLAVVRRAFGRGTPLLGICRGHQIINVAFGGTLRQDIGDDTIHKNLGAPVSRLMAGHPVELAAGSDLARALGVGRVRVQSAHHQTIDALGTGLVVVGTAPDGSPEAVEHRSAPITGVQFHPEDPGAPDGQLASLVAALGSVALGSAALDSAALGSAARQRSGAISLSA